VPFKDIITLHSARQAINPRKSKIKKNKVHDSCNPGVSFRFANISHNVLSVPMEPEVLLEPASKSLKSSEVIGGTVIFLATAHTHKHTHTQSG